MSRSPGRKYPCSVNCGSITNGFGASPPRRSLSALPGSTLDSHTLWYAQDDFRIHGSQYRFRVIHVALLNAYSNPPRNPEPLYCGSRISSVGSMVNRNRAMGRDEREVNMIELLSILDGKPYPSQRMSGNIIFHNS